tara:strand:+ start:532 stop:702 length:171 start_codon:yes stop_codon:yes gene_type:complete
MADVDKDIDKMIEEIKNPQQGKKWIFERADDKVYKREFGADPSTRILINPEEVKND